MNTGVTPDERAARRQIDLAVGILIGTHGYDEDQAFAELAAHARLDSAGLLPTARALVQLAQGRGTADASAAPLLAVKSVA